MKNYILTYQEFVIYHEGGTYYYEEVGVEGRKKVELIASVEYDVLHEPSIPLYDLFPCYVCGEYIHGEGISFVYFDLAEGE